ncbi:hypothetical protein [Alcaligenes faecalis]|uniref:hypothetical protein n=1 Tax=Alcaligenes faecalis TaxID=511 RepID=UPI00122D365D|nr:hypothetical protein [Alcaligenes faecalis]KAA1288465.1 hypothetical protein D7S43_00015 [Alcaligenes faecalis]
MKHLILALVLTVPTIASAQGIDFGALQRGRQQAEHDNYLDRLHQYDPNAAMYEQQRWEQQEYQRQLLEQQRRQNDLLEQQIRNQTYQNIHIPRSHTTNCQPNGYGGFVCSTR